jgi:hypothetical protein
MVVNLTGNVLEDRANQGSRKPLIDDDYRISAGAASTIRLAKFGSDENPAAGDTLIKQTTVKTVPPFYALAFIMFKGYS